MKPNKKVWDWRSYIIHYGPNNPTYRHLLLTLSCFMDSAGGSCFPSVETLVEATALTKPTVIKYLDEACKDGWILKSNLGLKGQKWRRNEYTASVPEKVVKEINHVPEKVVKQVNHVELEGGKTGDEGGKPLLPKVVKEFNQYNTSPITSPVNSPERASARESDFSSSGPEERLTASEIYRIARSIDTIPPEDLPGLLDNLFSRARDQATALQIWVGYLKSTGKPVNNFVLSQLLTEHQSTPLARLKQMIRYSMSRGYKSLVAPEAASPTQEAPVRASWKEFSAEEYLARSN